MSAETAEQLQLVIVTGPSGAGRTTAIDALEDLDFEAIDNLPLSLLSRLITGPSDVTRIAVGIDTRTRGFTAEALLSELEALGATPGLDLQLVFLDCSTETLLNRYSETRRRHPLAANDSPLVGIELERKLFQGLAERADLVIDTSAMTPHELRAELSRWFSTEKTPGLSVSVHSFSYKRGIPHGLDMVLDCRFLRNPHWEEALRPLTGLDSKVAEYVQQDPNYSQFYEKLVDICRFLLPAYKAEGKSYFSIGLGCTGGKHRSVCMAQALTDALASEGWQVSVRHRELERTQTSRHE
jgi:RNase adapter protein RapZ